MNKNRPILLTGKHGTGKTTQARKKLPNAVVYYANEINIPDVFSIPRNTGIIIEDIHYKPNKQEILEVLRTYRGEIIITSLNEKDVPSEIKTMCQIKRAGSKQHTLDSIKGIAPRSEKPETLEMDMYSLVIEYLKNSDRDRIKDILLLNKPADIFLINMLMENLNPNKLVFIDSVVKRRWKTPYFYEMLAYAHTGKTYMRPQFPKKRTYSKIPNLCRRLGLERNEFRLFQQLIEDEDFVKFAKSKLNNEECRLMGLGEKRKRKKTENRNRNLMEWI